MHLGDLGAYQEVAASEGEEFVTFPPQHQGHAAVADQASGTRNVVTKENCFAAAPRTAAAHSTPTHSTARAASVPAAAPWSSLGQACVADNPDRGGAPPSRVRQPPADAEHAAAAAADITVISSLTSASR